ncbi:MAG: hypothetical protein ACLS8R_08485 [Anaeromassilibacillus sp.]
MRDFPYTERDQTIDHGRALKPVILTTFFFQKATGGVADERLMHGTSAKVLLAVVFVVLALMLFTAAPGGSVVANTWGWWPRCSA